MTTKIDIGRLVKCFKQATQNENPTEIVVCDYLQNKVIKPLLSGELLYMSDIDLGGFSMEELENLRLFLSHSSDLSSSLNRLCSVVSGIKPQALSACAFC